MSDKELAEYIVSFLETRNRGELRPAFDEQTVASRRLMLEELEMILEHRGKPANWV